MIRQTNQEASIVSQLIFYIILFSSLITLLITILQLYLDYRRDVNLIEARMKEVKISFLPSVITSLWAVDKKQANVQLEGILQLPDIAYVEVSTEDQTRYSVGTRPLKNIISQKFRMVYHYKQKDKDINLGTLVIVASLEGVHQRLFDRVLIILGSNAVKTFLVSLFMFFLFQFLVTRHLKKISNYTRKLDIMNLDAPLALGRKAIQNSRGDELEQVVSAINEMQGNLRDSYEEINQYKEHLEEKVEERTKELKESFSLLNATFKSTTDGILIVDENRVMVGMNQKFIEMWSIPQEIVTAKDEKKALSYILDQLVDPETFLAKVQELYDQPESESFDILDFKDGRVFERYSTPQQIGEQRMGRVWSFRDKTQRKYTQAQLIQSSKLASLGEMATGVAHELNQPLGIININAEIGQEDSQEGHHEEIGKRFGTILKQVKRASKIINHLRTFGRDTSQLQYEKVDVNKIIKDSFILIGEQLKLQDIEVVEELSENLPQVLCNAHQIEQVITNLLNNAKDALEDTESTKEQGHIEGPPIQHSPKQLIVRSFLEGDDVVIEVSDTGIGIPQEHLDQIFDPFFTTKEVGKGTGLGLSISYSIIQDHKGQLSVESETGVGTTFRIYLSITKP